MKKNKFAYILVATLLMTSCGSQSDEASYTETAPAEAPDYDYAKDSYATEEAQADETITRESGSGESGLSFANNATEYKREAMFAKEGWIQNQVKGKADNKDKIFDETILQVETLVEKYDGYLESANYNEYGGKHFETTIKVPVKDFQNLYNELKKTGNNIYNESTVVNKTSGYYSLKSQLEVQKLSKARLEDLIGTTKNSKDLLKLYDNYFDLVANIETMEATLSQIESSTSYSTIHYSLDDLNNNTYIVDDSFTSKIKEGFGASISFIENFIILFAYISVPLILCLIGSLLVYKKFGEKIENKMKNYNKEGHVKLDDDKDEENN